MTAPELREVPTFAVLRRRASTLLRRIADTIHPPPDFRPADPYNYVGEIRDRLPRDDQHVLGCGLVSTADVTIEVRRGGRTMYVNPSMDSITAEVIKTGAYGELEIERVHSFVSTVVSPAGWVINVGANIGTTAIALAERGRRVVAVEPVPRAAELLHRNIEANGHAGSIVVSNVAVTSTPTTVEMVAGDNLSTSEVRSGHSVEELATPGDVRATVITVEGVPLTRVIARHELTVRDISFVWSDTEGFEGQVIAGGIELWASGIPLWTEIRPSALRDQGPITEFCAVVAEHFVHFQTIEDFDTGTVRSVASLRDFIDDLGYGRWTFTNVLMTPRVDAAP